VPTVVCRLPLGGHGRQLLQQPALGLTQLVGANRCRSKQQWLQHLASRHQRQQRAPHALQEQQWVASQAVTTGLGVLRHLWQPHQQQDLLRGATLRSAQWDRQQQQQVSTA
jgi:hypothetical protein